MLFSTTKLLNSRFNNDGAIDPKELKKFLTTKIRLIYSNLDDKTYNAKELTTIFLNLAKAH